MAVTKQHLKDSIEAHRGREWEKLEKILLTVVGGTLAASTSALLFSEKETLFIYRHVLLTSWILLSISLISLLSSYAISEFLNRNRLTRLKNFPESINENDISKLDNKLAYLGIDITNYAALGCGIFGIITLMLFAYLNIN